MKNNTIKDDFTAQGLDKARQILSFDNLTDVEKKKYGRLVEEKRIRDSEINTAFLDGEIKTLERIVVDGNNNGFSLEQIQSITKLSREQITEILKRYGLL